MPSLLIHLTHGPEAPTRAALGFLVARAPLDEGREVSLFLATTRFADASARSWARRRPRRRRRSTAPCAGSETDSAIAAT